MYFEGVLEKVQKQNIQRATPDSGIGYLGHDPREVVMTNMPQHTYHTLHQCPPKSLFKCQ